MNCVILMGRLCRNPEVRYSSDGSNTNASFTLAVDRKFKKDGDVNADFIRCVGFGKVAEFVEKYIKQGTKIVVTGRIQTGSYTNKDGNKVYTTDVVAENIEFAESKNAAGQSESKPRSKANDGVKDGADGFMQIDPDISEELPFL